MTLVSQSSGKTDSLMRISTSSGNHGPGREIDHLMEAAGDIVLRLDLAGQVRFASRRDGADIMSWSGGRLRTRWDLPRDASGAPFACDATLNAFSSIAEADGLRRITIVAASPRLTRPSPCMAWRSKTSTCQSRRCAISRLPAAALRRAYCQPALPACCLT